MADNLESYFKKKLSEDTVGEEDWNVPSDKVWEKVLPEIQKKRGLFIPWRYFYLIGILLIAGLASILWFVNTTDADEDEVIPIVNTEIENSSPDNIKIQNIEQPSFNTDNNSTGQTQIVANEFGSATKQEIENNTEKTNSSNKTSHAAIAADSKANNRSDKTIKEKNESPTTLFPENQNTAISNDIIFTTDRESSQIQLLTNLTIDDISAPVAYRVDQKETAQPKAIDKNYSSRKEPINNKGRFGIGAFIVPTFNATSVAGEPSSGAIETSNMLMYSTNWGVELRYHISNRFTLVTGIGKSEIKSWSKSYIDFGYDTSTEHLMPSGEKQNTSPLPMQTPFGKIDTEITYQFAGSEELPDGELMQSSMETHQDVRYLSIPLGVEFNIIRFSRFSWFAEGGVRYNRAMKDATQFTSRVLHNGDDMDVVSEKLMGSPSYTENYLSFYVGTGLNYQISKSFQLSGSARYFGNITRVNLQDNMSTYVQGFDFKVGVIFIF